MVVLILGVEKGQEVSQLHFFFSRCFDLTVAHATPFLEG